VVLLTNMAVTLGITALRTTIVVTLPADSSVVVPNSAALINRS